MSLATLLRETLIAVVDECPDERPALMLSGGVDSHSILYALLSCGRKPIAYSFTLEDRESSDFTAARDLARHWSVPFRAVVLPTDRDSLLRDIGKLFAHGAETKAQIECGWAFFRTIEAIAQDGRSTHVLRGIGVDSLFGMSKKAMIHFRHSVAGMDRYRAAAFSNPDTGQRRMVSRYARTWGLRVLDPYIDPRVFALFEGTSWDELNRPRQKQVVLDAFGDHFAETKRPAPHTNLQLGDSGIAELWGRTFLDPSINRSGHRSVVGVYNELRRKGRR